MEKKKKIVLISFITIIAIAFAMIPVIKRNQKYPATEKVMIKKETTSEIREGLSFSIQETKWMDREELEKNYADVLEMGEDRDYKAAFVTATLKNETSKEQKYEVYRLYIESDDIHYYNGLDMELYTAIEGNPSAEVTLKPKEEITVILPYSVLDLYFEKNQWNTLEENRFYLVEQRYPKKICWEI